MKDLRLRELLAVTPLVGLLIFAGVYPQPVLDIINPAVKVTMAQVAGVMERFVDRPVVDQAESGGECGDVERGRGSGGAGADHCGDLGDDAAHDDLLSEEMAASCEERDRVGVRGAGIDTRAG